MAWFEAMNPNKAERAAFFEREAKKIAAWPKLNNDPKCDCRVSPSGMSCTTCKTCADAGRQNDAVDKMIQSIKGTLK
jgi:hypothetical protein